jgi:tetratricopeptide (TPR) repeat protein
MDWLDRISIWAIVILIIGSFGLISGHVGEAKPDRHEQQRIAATDTSSVRGETESTIKLIKNIIEADNLDQAEILIKDLMQKYPYEGEPHMLIGDILMRRQEPVKAVLEYKEAIGLNPDYLDKKTPLFQGKKLKVAVGEALAEVDKRIRLNPSDESMKNDRKTIYFLQRKIAGSCS